MSVIIFIIILAVLVFVHELGHFLAAKMSGIRVDEFGIGFPPKLLSARVGETRYSLNLIPFGGYVKIFGENPDTESIDGPVKHRSFVHKPKHIQAFVLAAGVLFNVIFAWLLISLGFMIGMPVPENYTNAATIENLNMTVTGVEPRSPAEEGGLKQGDILKTLQSGEEKLENFNGDQFREFISARKDKEIIISIIRGSESKQITVIPRDGVVPDRAAIGVVLELLGTVRLPFHLALWEGLKLTGFLVYMTAIGLGSFLYHAVIGQAPLAEVAGPVGIAGLVSDASALGFVYLLSFTAFISINLAVINLIPFPALDGGRILFVIIEKIKRGRISPKVSNTINAVGFGLLIVLMIIITYNDIVKLFQ